MSELVVEVLSLYVKIPIVGAEFAAVVDTVAVLEEVEPICVEPL